jgi:proteasome lid subunit RPN8/RPN11
VTLRIADCGLRKIVAHARDAAPAECCGLLVGRSGEIVDATPTRNIAEGVSRFVIDPKDHIDGRREARRRGLEVVGFYHSHPHSPAEPSPTDVAEASYPDHLYLIVSLAAEPPDVAVFRLDEGGIFHRVKYVVGPQPDSSVVRGVRL